MPTPPPTSPAAPAAAPATPPAAPVATPPAASPSDRHPAHEGLMRRLMSEVDEEPTGQKPATVAEVPKPADGTPAAPAAGAPKPADTPAPGDPPIRSRKPAPPKRPDLPMATPAAVPTPPAAPVPQQSDEEFEKGLVDAEKQMLADARYAEKFDGKKYGGLADKVKSFIKAHTKFLEDHPDIEDDDPAYKKFLVDNRPALSQQEVRDIEEHRIAERARGPVNERVGKLEHELFVRDETPKIDRFGDETYRQLVRDALPADILTLVKEKGGLTKEVQDQFGEELDTAHQIFTIVADDLKEFQRITTKHPGTQKPVVEFDDSNQQHVRLAQMVGDLCDSFLKGGGQQLQRNGKWFVTRDEWTKIDPARRGEYWTFTNKEIMARALSIVPKTVTDTIRIKREEMERRGYVRKAPVAPAPAAVPAPVPAAGSPAIRPSPVPSGGGSPSEVNSTTKSLAGLLTAE